MYWVQNEDLSTEITSADEKIPEETPEAQVESDDNTVDGTTPMKRHKETTDDDYMPSSSEEDKQQVKIKKSVGQLVRRTSREEEGLELKITGVTTLGTKPKGGKHFTDETGYVYYQHSTTAFKRQLKCVFANVAKFKCQAKASMALDPRDSPIVLSSKSVPHNHPPENEKTFAGKFAKCLKKRVLEEPNLSVREIYEDESKKCPLSAKLLPENIALQRMRRYRRVYNRSINGEPEHPEPPSDGETPGASTELQMFSDGKIIYIDSKGYQYHQQYASAHKRPTDQQISALLKFVEEHPVFMTGELLNDEKGRVLLNSLWKDLKMQLNSIKGPSKSTKQWQKFWTTCQLKAKRKAAFMKKKVLNESTESSPKLTDLESRVASMIKIAIDSINDSGTPETFHKSVHRSIASDTDVDVSSLEFVSTVEAVSAPTDLSRPKVITKKHYGMVSMVQRGIIIAFMENNPSLRNVDVSICEETFKSEEFGKWQKLVNCLNTCGPEKSVAVWGKVWGQMKLSALAKRDKAAERTSASPYSMNDIDARVIACLETPNRIISDDQQPQSPKPKELIEHSPNTSNQEYNTFANQSKPRSGRIRDEQKIALINYLEKNKEMLKEARFKNYEGPAYRQMWADLTNLLNSLPGPKNSAAKWQRCLACYKSVARRKQEVANASKEKRIRERDRYLYPITRFEKRLIELSKYLNDGTEESSLAEYIHEGAGAHDGAENSEEDDVACTNANVCDRTDTTNSFKEKSAKIIVTKKSVEPEQSVMKKDPPVAIDMRQLIMESSLTKHIHEDAGTRDGGENSEEEDAACTTANATDRPNSVKEKGAKMIVTMKSVKERAYAVETKQFVKKTDPPVALDTHQLIMVADEMEEFLTRGQVRAMIEFMKANPLCDLYKWDEDKTNPRLVPFWDYLSKKLNKLGPNKDPDRWKKCWCLLKDSAYKKALLEEELSSFEQQILKFAKSKPVFVVQKDQKEVIVMNENARKTVSGDVEVRVVEQELGEFINVDKIKKEIHLQNQQETPQVKDVKSRRKDRKMTELQKQTLVGFLQSNPKGQLLKFGSSVAKHEYSAIWTELAGKLNSLGTPKPVAKWQRCWTDFKCQVKKKARKKGSRLTKLEREVWRMKNALDETAEPIISPGQLDKSYVTVNMEDLQNAINRSISEAGGTEIVLTVESNEHQEE